MRRQHALNVCLRRQLGVALLSVLALAGCAGAPPRAAPSEPAPAPAASSAAVAPLASAPTVSAQPSATESLPAPSAPPERPCARMGWVDACANRSEQTWLEGDAREAWYTSRGAKPPQREIEPVCREITVGPTREAALLCERIQHETHGKPGTPLHTFRVLSLVSVRTVRNKQALTLIELPYQVDLLDKDELDDGPLFALELEAPSELTELVLREPGSDACAGAERTLKRHRDEARAAKDAVQLAWARLDEELRARICRAAGKYTWQNARFLRAPARASVPVSGISGP